ncbi:transporter [Micromonospora cremea]|uniref:SLAC1 family transporter n=1 Tax=Micromonospora cremea TaxID=709881 RepID=UPI00118136C9|nr:transporter [Micromonospora cremea]
MLDKMHPGYFLPTVAGGLIAAAGAAALGQQRLAQALFGLGLICWLILGSIMLGRLFVRPVLPAPLTPTLAIEVAPAAVASLAYFALNGDRLDLFAVALGGYGPLMVLAQIRLLPVFLRLTFAPSTWAFTFSWAVVASAALHWIHAGRPARTPRRI